MQITVLHCIINAIALYCIRLLCISQHCSSESASAVLTVPLFNLPFHSSGCTTCCRDTLHVTLHITCHVLLYIPCISRNFSTDISQYHTQYILHTVDNTLTTLRCHISYHHTTHRTTRIHHILYYTALSVPLSPLYYPLSSISSPPLLYLFSPSPFPYPRCEVFDFRSLEVLVLDEADTLLAMGFRENISQILAFLPKQRRYVCQCVVVV